VRLHGRCLRPNVFDVLRESDIAGRNLERSAQNELPDKKERHQSAEREPPESFTEINVSASRSRHSRPEFTPNHCVRNGNQDSYEPSEHRLGAIQCRHESGNGYERANPDHIRHVECGGLEQAKAPLKVRLGSGNRNCGVAHDAQQLA
jgi:hypothetical protein